MNTTSQQDGTPPTYIVYVQAPPRTPTNFSDNLYEDVDDWLSQYERVAGSTDGGLSRAYRMFTSLWKAPHAPGSKTTKRRFCRGKTSRPSFDAPLPASSDLATMYKKDETVKRLVDEYEWRIHPVVNPDGYAYTHTIDRLWRKTRSVSKISGGCRGADANRNFDVGPFCGVGTSNDTCSEIYCGDNPFSEPETRALRDAVLAAQDRVSFYFSLHSYSLLWMFPYSYTTKNATNYQELEVSLKHLGQLETLITSAKRLVEVEAELPPCSLGARGCHVTTQTKTRSLINAQDLTHTDRRLLSLRSGRPQALADKVLEVASPTVSNIQAPLQAQQVTVGSSVPEPIGNRRCSDSVNQGILAHQVGAAKQGFLPVLPGVVWFWDKVRG
ncbi:hypothetical protein HPB47_017107 [Ixodes persulcatus]|uniref:Uncharacterized protein n=1 Tax=Ixodes persulcatus TaxID=34615 RepID=A0AC60QQ66_IXOPE|nr:hypothetical protein HPB47_017107 [Ixodes persulcatus]